MAGNQEEDMFSISNEKKKKNNNNTQQFVKNYKDLKDENESLKEVIQDLKNLVRKP